MGDREDALQRVRRLEVDYQRVKRERHESWVDAKDKGATQAQIAAAAGVARTTVADQMWVASHD